MEQFRKFAYDTDYKTAAESETGLGIFFFGRRTFRNLASARTGSTRSSASPGKKRSNSAPGCRRKSTPKFVCPPRPSGNTPARAGTASKFFYGDNDESKLKDNIWFSGNGDVGMTQPVGLKKPNRWGLFDVCGNAREWCSDWYDAKYYAASPKVDPIGPEAGSCRVARGADFQTRNEDQCRTAKRWSSARDPCQRFGVPRGHGSTVNRLVLSYRNAASGGRRNVCVKEIRIRSR